jgi:hypothetical protein
MRSVPASFPHIPFPYLCLYIVDPYARHAFKQFLYSGCGLIVIIGAAVSSEDSYLLVAILAATVHNLVVCNTFKHLQTIHKRSDHLFLRLVISS